MKPKSRRKDQSKRTRRRILRFFSGGGDPGPGSGEGDRRIGSDGDAARTGNAAGMNLSVDADDAGTCRDVEVWTGENTRVEAGGDTGACSGENARDGAGKDTGAWADDNVRADGTEGA